MSRNRQPNWSRLTIIGLFGGAALLIVARLPLSPGAQELLLILWVVAFYATLGHWTAANSKELDQSPRLTEFKGLPFGAPPLYDAGKMKKTVLHGLKVQRGSEVK